MNRQGFSLELAAYGERWRTEHERVARFTELIALWPACLLRDHFPGHITASGWVVHPPSDAVLLTHHRKLDKWLQLGGHVDGEDDLIGAARREVLEESGVAGVTHVVSGGAIFDMDIHPIPAHRREPAHEHFDVRFAFAAPERIRPRVSDESHDVAWVPLDELERFTTEESMLRMRRKWRALSAVDPVE